MRPLKNPENYATGKEVADMLREVAADCEKRGDMVNVHVNFWYASPIVYRMSMAKKFGPDWDKPKTD